MRPRAFTLIELLVVVAIVAILTAILLPSLSRAREQAKAVVCSSNLHQLLVAVVMYADTHGGRFPTAGFTHGGQGNEESKSWVNQIAEEYGRNAAIARCPSDASRYWTKPLPDGRLRRTSYASNSYTAFAIGDKTAYDRWERIARPAATIFWAELTEDGEYAAADHVHPESWWFGDSNALAAEQVAIARHARTAVYAMLDGHAQRLAFEQTYLIRPDSGFPPEFLTNRYDPEIAR